MFKPLDSRRSKHHFFIAVTCFNLSGGKLMSEKVTIYGMIGCPHTEKAKKIARRLIILM
jgi:hypothetical protein